jgi:hypothetical protein
MSARRKNDRLEALVRRRSCLAGGTAEYQFNLAGKNGLAILSSFILSTSAIDNHTTSLGTSTFLNGHSQRSREIGTRPLQQEDIHSSQDMEPQCLDRMAAARNKTPSQCSMTEEIAKSGFRDLDNSIVYKAVLPPCLGRDDQEETVRRHPVGSAGTAIAKLGVWMDSRKSLASNADLCLDATLQRAATPALAP